MNYKDYYAILGVPKTSTEKDIKSAYRKLARKWHPDQNPTNAKQAEEKFKDIQEAYEVLGDPEKRRKYDVLGSDWQNAAREAERQRTYRQQADFGNFNFNAGGAAPGAGASGFSDFFDMFFSGIGRRGGAGPSGFTTQAQRGEDLESTIELSLHDAYEGGKKPITLQVEDICPRCHGTGTDRNRICPQCHGTGRIRETKKFDVTIPRGVRDGQRIRLSGQGASGPGSGPRGDLYLVVHLGDDEQYERKGDDLYVDLPVSIYDLLLGADVRVPTMTGDVTMTIPAGTQNNKMLRLTGKGMPKLKNGGYGDEYVRLIGQLPTNLTDKETKLFRELATLRNGKAHESR
ncbi:molecular chaperone DnaJ [Vulcanimicrobium alpinum]|uniref:Chaperone protein DnaJ n=1 Tax=Vulcanimicrobium alpinum TaxID=3016050 RepID=A0AAN2C8Y7_UNVUL|nr:J domain-containing protein [Vulcanimicrobium alpinum]BDE05456.1 molecular chaperone DnaJ [Vulcanimicrobium alpinum]